MDDTSSRKKRATGEDSSVESRCAEPVTEPAAPDVSQRRSVASADILPMPTNRVRRARAKPRPKVEEHISRQLRAIYDDVVAQPIPDRFVELLRELEAGSKGSGGGGDA